MIEDFKLSIKLAVQRHRFILWVKYRPHFPSEHSVAVCKAWALSTKQSAQSKTLAQLSLPIFLNLPFQLTLNSLDLFPSFFFLVYNQRLSYGPNSTPLSNCPGSIQNSKRGGEQMRSDTPSNSPRIPIKNWHLLEARAPIGKARMIWFVWGVAHCGKVSRDRHLEHSCSSRTFSFPKAVLPSLPNYDTSCL